MKVYIYEYINNDFLFLPVNGLPISIELTEESINPIFAISFLIANKLGIPNSPDLTNQFSNPSIQRILQHVTYFTFYISDSAYVPYKGINATQQFSENPPSDLLLERFTLSESFPISDSCEFSAHKNPDFMILHFQDFSPYFGLTEALYGGFFIKSCEKWNHYHIPKGQFPSTEALASVKGIVLTGSRHCTYDENLLWIGDAIEVLRKARTNNTRLVGICFGHQLLAKAFGGKTGENPTQEFVYKHEICTGRNRERFRIMQSHRDCVTQLPEGAEDLFMSESCRYEVIRIGDKVLSTQGHPEFTTYLVKNFLSKRRRDMGFSTQQVYERIISECEDESDSLRILQTLNNFLRNGIILFG